MRFSVETLSVSAFSSFIRNANQSKSTGVRICRPTFCSTACLSRSIPLSCNSRSISLTPFRQILHF